jgi:hypothetical protein
MQTSPRLRLLALLAAAAWAPVAVAAQTAFPAYRTRVLAVYTTDGDPIEGAQVVDEVSKTSALTTRTGTISLSFLPEGATLVRVRKVGYVEATMLVNIAPTDTLPVMVMLKAGAQALERVVTTDSAPMFLSPGLRGFEERRAKGGGYFISTKELRKWDSGPLTPALRNLPGVDIICIRTPGPRMGECYASNKRAPTTSANRDCPVDIYLDGALYFQAVGAAGQFGNDLQRLQTTQFAGVEFYSGMSRVPPEFNKSGARCGVLVLWTRER